MTVKFEYAECPVSALKTEIKKDGKNKPKVSKITLNNGLEVLPTDRFWKSLQMRFRFSDNIFKYFPPEEVFKRISEVSPNDKVRWCVEHTGTVPKLLSVTNPTKAGMITFENLLEVLGTYGAEKVDYANGVVRSRHVPSVSVKNEIAGEFHENRFIVDCPIDGFGKPNIYLSLLRQVCTNGAIAFAPAFRSELTVGKGSDSIEQSISRALEGFNNEEGFSALTERFQSAAESWASVSEAMLLYRLVMKCYNEKQLRNVKLMKIGGDEADVSFYDNIPPLKGFMNMVGDLNKNYGLSNLDALSPKRQKVLPTSAKVYDILNYASELATHHMEPRGGRMLQSYIGTMVAQEYDLQGTCSKFPYWRDFFVSDDNAQTTVTEMANAG